VVEAHAPGKLPWSTTVEVAAGDANVRVEVSALDDASAAPARPVSPVSPAAPAPPVSPGPDTSTRPRAAGAGLGPLRTAGVVVGSAGVAAVGVGSVLGLMAMSQWSQIKRDHCGGTTTCDATGVALAEEARSKSTASAALLATGGAAIVAGVVLVIAPRRRGTPSVGVWVVPSVEREGAGLSAQGAF
jgi:hypothetical protein